ncbi:hypothetical protein BpHYR1_015019 [Brachionus plicatilis]|uniref:Transmembrane protein n=1 Tax=Brachionus plicatilis TaxID=10195 RepID=A0A3M7T4U5_BRAPC|nr:hypothetical protein BpHYR1_015019 [Brachionus plicatilis]
MFKSFAKIDELTFSHYVFFSFPCVFFSLFMFFSTSPQYEFLEGKPGVKHKTKEILHDSSVLKIQFFIIHTEHKHIFIHITNYVIWFQLVSKLALKSFTSSSTYVCFKIVKQEQRKVEKKKYLQQKQTRAHLAAIVVQIAIYFCLE